MPSKKSIIDMKSAAKIYYPGINVRIRRDNPVLYEGIDSASKDMGISVSEYLRVSAREKLIRDGYMLESDK